MDCKLRYLASRYIRSAGVHRLQAVLLKVGHVVIVWCSSAYRDYASRLCHALPVCRLSSWLSHPLDLGEGALEWPQSLHLIPPQQQEAQIAGADGSQASLHEEQDSGW